MNDIEIDREQLRTKAWFGFTLFYLFIDYGRPQDIFHALGYLRPAMIATLILVGFLLAKGFKYSDSKQMRMIWLFIILLSIYIPFARNNYYAYVATHDMLLYMPFILSLVICVDSIERLRKMIHLCIWIMLMISIFAIFHKGQGTGNYFKDENDLSLYINMWLPFCYFLFNIETEKKKKLVYLSGIILGISAVILSFSRGGFVGLIAVLLVLWLRSSKKILSLLLIGLIVIMIVLVASDQYWQRIDTITNTTQGTAAGRIESWKAAWKMFLDYPLGVGGNNFPTNFEDYQTDFFKRGMWGRAAHSIWFTLIPELGIAGVIIYLTLLKYNIRDIVYLSRLNYQDNPDLKYLHALSGAFVVSLVGYFVSGTFLSVLYYPHYWYMTGLIIAAKRISLEKT